MTKIAHIFPGQGAYFAGVLRRPRFAYVDVEVVLGAVESVTYRRLGRSLVETMWDENCGAEHLLKLDPALLQLAIFTVSVAASKVLQEHGVEADVLMGHSFGEIAALTCAGVFTVEQGAEIVCDRIEALDAAAPQDGRMAAISASPGAVRTLLDEWSAGRPVVRDASELTVAVENHENQTVISGPEGDVTAFIDHCKSRKLSAPNDGRCGQEYGSCRATPNSRPLVRQPGDH
jgi:acyl transferase domain-containing protein